MPEQSGIRIPHRIVSGIRLSIGAALIGLLTVFTGTQGGIFHDEMPSLVYKAGVFAWFGGAVLGVALILGLVGWRWFSDD